MAPAPLWRRFAAFGIDALVMILTVIILALFMAIVIAVAEGNMTTADWIAEYLPLLVWLGYYVRGQWRRGGTLGERAMRIALVSCPGGGSLRLEQVCARAFFALLLFWTLPLAGFSSLRQAPYDRLLDVQMIVRQSAARG